MAKFRKSLQYNETLTSSSSESENEDFFVPSNNEDSDLSPPVSKKRKRQSKLPSKFREYETEGSAGNINEEEQCKLILLFIFH